MVGLRSVKIDSARCTSVVSTASAAALMLCATLLLLPLQRSYAETAAPRPQQSKRVPAGAEFFADGKMRTGFFESDAPAPAVKPQAPAAVAPAPAAPAPAAPAPVAPAPVAPVVAPSLDLRSIASKLDVRGRLAQNFVSNDPSVHLLPPDVVPPVRINPDAPGPFIGMALAHRQGDEVVAREYAKSWVKYQMNFLFEIRELTELIGDALIEQKVVEEDDWTGVGHFIDYEMAQTRKASGDPFKPTHDKAMERIESDPKNQAEIYFFFTLNCSWCRRMAPDVERLYRTIQRDSKVKMVALNMGKVPRDWMAEYRQFTGMTVPVFEGAAQAKAFRVGYVPALVVVAPNTKQAYLKTGEQSFARMYEFVRKVQGLPAEVTPEIEALISTPIGEQEMMQARSGKFRGTLLANRVSGGDPRRRGVTPVSLRPKATSERLIERF